MNKIMIALALLTMNFAYSMDVDLNKSSFKWTGSKVIGSNHQGTVKLKSAKFDGSKGEFVVDMSSIDVTDLEGEWKDKFLGHIKSGDFFEVEKYPTAKLVVDKIDTGFLYGTLTVKDKSHPVSMAVEKKDNTYTGTLAFDRTKVGLIYGSGNFFKNLGDKTISDTVRIDVKVVTK